MIFATVLSPKVFVVLTRSNPERLMHPDEISSPLLISRGMLSPVSATVLSDDVPETTMPSSGTFSPGLTMIVSPTATSSGATVISSPLRSTWAVSGRISIRWEMLSRLLPSAYSSKSSPIWKNNMTNTASANSVSAPGIKPMQRAPMVAMVIRKSSLKTSPATMPSAASFNVSCPTRR